MNYEELLKIVLLAFVVSPICLTITKTKVFQPMRTFIMSKNKWLGKLFSCPYCLGHWTSFAATAVFRPVAFSCDYFFLIDLAVSAFIMIALSTIISGFVYQAVVSMDE